MSNSSASEPAIPQQLLWRLATGFFLAGIVKKTAVWSERVRLAPNQESSLINLGPAKKLYANMFGSGHSGNSQNSSGTRRFHSVSQLINPLAAIGLAMK
jgi:hypothetical protein